jgi:hypothetical protein
MTAEMNAQRDQASNLLPLEVTSHLEAVEYPPTLHVSPNGLCLRLELPALHRQPVRFWFGLELAAVHRRSISHWNLGPDSGEQRV